MVQRRIDDISVLLNNTCNLRCGHCYLEGTRKSGYELSLEEWGEVIDSVFTYTKTLNFSGKEVFLDDSTSEVFFRTLKKKRDNLEGPGVGVITNGTLVGNYRTKLIELSPYLSDVNVSFDGPQEFHNSVRKGRGNMFERAIESLEWIAETFDDRLTVTATFFDQNVDLVPQMIQELRNYGDIRRFSLALYVDPMIVDSKDLTCSAKLMKD